MYTTTDAARRLRLSSRRIRQAIQSYGVGRKIGRDWMLSETDIEYIRQRIGQVGRPRSSDASN